MTPPGELEVIHPSNNTCPLSEGDCDGERDGLSSNNSVEGGVTFSSGGGVRKGSVSSGDGGLQCTGGGGDGCNIGDYSRSRSR